uniref:Uncharacterized protein n=1 Tax=Arundo donax TaxID=35708 RepID=A0A0A9E5X0_ARUDO
MSTVLAACTPAKMGAQGLGGNRILLRHSCRRRPWLGFQSSLILVGDTGSRCVTLSLQLTVSQRRMCLERAAMELCTVGVL